MAIPEKQLYAAPAGSQSSALTEKRGPGGYWRVPCPVAFEHKGRQITHRGLVALSGPMRTWDPECRRKPAQLKALHQALSEIQTKIGRPRYRTVEAVQKRANTQLKKSPADKFMGAQAYADSLVGGSLHPLAGYAARWPPVAQQCRYLLVTNDCSLSPQRMLAPYRQKDGLEKRFTPPPKVTWKSRPSICTKMNASKPCCSSTCGLTRL